MSLTGIGSLNKSNPVVLLIVQKLSNYLSKHIWN